MLNILAGFGWNGEGKQEAEGKKNGKIINMEEVR